MIPKLIIEIDLTNTRPAILKDSITAVRNNAILIFGEHNVTTKVTEK